MTERIVSVTNDILGQQFSPYLQGLVMPQELKVGGEQMELLVQIDPIDVDPTYQPSETWEVEQIHPISYQFEPWDTTS